MEDDIGEILVFYVNGKKICDRKPDPKATLLQYLRRKLCLPGTKEGCGHGGCGSCTVMISRYDVIRKAIQIHYAVNACLFPVCAAHGLAVTTVEGVGNPATGLHAIQRRLIESHGLQCGFCTPGFVMSAFALQRNFPNPTCHQIESAIEGNLCRCTGYRSIVDALFGSSEDSCPNGDACCRKKPAVIQTSIADKLGDDSQVAIFPPELQLNCEKYFNNQVKFTDGVMTWIRPASLNELLVLKQKYPQAPIIMGNLTTGSFIAKGTYDEGRVLIYGGSVKELQNITSDDDGISVGGACTISEFSRFLDDISKRSKDKRIFHFEAILNMLSTYGSEQIRNVSTIAGSIMCDNSTSDIQTLFKALNVAVTVASVEGIRTGTILDIEIQSHEIIQSVGVPFCTQGEFSAFYKLSGRRTFSVATINSGILAKLNEQKGVEDLRLCFGGIGNNTVVLKEAQKMAENRSWDKSLYEDIVSVICKTLGNHNEEKDLGYKVSVATACWFKFFHKVCVELQLCKADTSLTDPVSLPPYHSRQVFGDCTDTGQSEDNALGRTVPNIHSEPAVSGEATYVDDIPKLQDELFLALVLSSKAHAKIRKVDTTRALSIPGVKDFIDHNDIPGQKTWGSVVQDQELFSSGEVICYGQIIGGIIAEDRETAQRAADMVSIEYEELTPILTIEDAIKENSYYGEIDPFIDGDVNRGMGKSHHVIEGEYRTGIQEHFYMEPQAALAVPRESQEMEINVTCHGLQALQVGVSKVLDIPLHKITCRVKRLGGSFGGKDAQAMNVAGPAAVAAYKTKKPVRCTLPRKTDMLVKGKRHPFLAKYKVGFDGDGKILAIDLKLYMNAGHSNDYSVLIMEFTTTVFESGYKVKDIRVEGYVCKTNVPSNTAFRATGHPQGALIMEDIIFQVANRLNISSDKVREVNLYKTGDVTTFGMVLKNCTLEEMWRKCQQESKYEERLKCIQQYNKENRWKKRGISMTASKYPIGMRVTFIYQGAALVNIYTDGSVLLTHGGVEMGQGLNTKLIQVASSVLGIPMKKIHTIESNTAIIPNPIQTGASLGMDLFGPAVHNACEILNKRLSPLKNEMPGCSWEELISAAYFKRIQLSATGFNRPVKNEQLDPKKKGGELVEYLTYGVACSEVEIDVLTGETQVLQADLYMDIGKSLNPALDVGQIEGAFVQGLGMVTSESMEIDKNGRTNNCDAISYKIPNITSIPRKMTVNILTNHNVSTCFNSSKAVGEPPLLLSLSVIAAIKEAVLAARTQIGQNGYFRLDSPATMKRIQEACGKQI